MLFYKAKNSNIKNLKALFLRYVECSGQYVNPHKSIIYAGSISPMRSSYLASSIGFSEGSLPFQYLGVPIFKGKPKVIHLHPIVDRIKEKLATWKASLLSMAGRVQIIKSIIHGILTYNLLIYSWPASPIKDPEKCMINFFWIGDSSKRKLITVAWHKVCTPQSEGGLGTRSLFKIHEAAKLKLCWELLTSDRQWANFLRLRVMRNKIPIKYHIFSSIWLGIKNQFQKIVDNSTWNLGQGNTINFWTDQWCGKPLVEQLQIQHHNQPFSKVADFILNGHWNFPPDLLLLFPSIPDIINKICIPLEPKEDELRWNHSSDGNLTLKDAY
ncbi:unnamed protein product [Vicia faba]|nr:unnamed protein product [Vicia faba]